MASLEEYNNYIDSIINQFDTNQSNKQVNKVKSINEICGYHGVTNGSKDLKNWNNVIANVNNITQYWCIYQTSFEKIGNTGDIIPDIQTEYTCNIHCRGHRSCTAYKKCSSFSSCVKNKVSIQSECVGHKLTTSDFRDQIENFPVIKSGKQISFEFFNQLAEIINFQIAERYKSTKYKQIYNNKRIITPIEKINQSSINTSIKKQQIDYGEYMSQIITKLSCMQPDNEYDNYPTTKKLKTLKNIQYAMQGSSNTEFETNQNKQIKPSMVISKDNINTIIKVIKEDLNDCICYSDCNGYSVCYCYGNCNHY